MAGGVRDSFDGKIRAQRLLNKNDSSINSANNAPKNAAEEKSVMQRLFGSCYAALFGNKNLPLDHDLDGSYQRAVGDEEPSAQVKPATPAPK